MSNPLSASNPDLNATVNASAGTGKTWLLVTRLIRLLLSGARADGILAVTFTRKAATEMQTRLNDRLLEMAQCEPTELENLLRQIDAPTDAATLLRATTLYEDLLRSPFTVKTTTFHAFCQDMLSRFPLEAGIPPGFELLESTAELQQAAWDALCAEASRNPQSPVAQAIEALFESCHGLANTQTALNSFLEHRSDWWAFTESQQEPISFAIATLSAQLKVSGEDEPERDFFNSHRLSLLDEFVALLQKHPGKQNNESLSALAIARDDSENIDQRFSQCCTAFLTASGSPRARKESKAQAKSMGEAGQQRFLEIHLQLCDAIKTTLDIRNAMESLRRTSAWYQAGSGLLEHYQRLKAEQRMLDFSDLEWQAYQLLNHSDNVHWIQYKLDQRIDHLLIDEFQDTNPTQWRLILPLLEELAACENQASRSVFLVGDSKQSIYRFRRADPELFVTAQSWLENQLQAITQPLDTSWRSADAIMHLVNQVFSEGPLHQRLMQFSTHTTHHPQLQGHVEFLPLIKDTTVEAETSTNEAPDGDRLRNPLHTPRLLVQDERHLNEGRLIAQTIRRLMDADTFVGPADAARPLHFGDIIILLRHRTHAGDYEQALREADIPYIGANRGTLLQSLEVQDLVRLLSLLTTPFNNLALASLLRSPLFECRHDDLIALASQHEGDWMKRLTELAATQDSASPVHRAHTLLQRWRELVGKVPVHDLLDRIYCEGDVFNRYHAAYPTYLQHRAAANLTRFLELALEIDSGRYPTIGRFVAHLHTLQQQERDAPDEGSPLQAGSRVRLMTIHAAKGLEAPVVFLADATNTGSNHSAHRAVVDWPAQAPRPSSFLLASAKEQRDPFTQNLLEQHASADAREDANLLYVAITRPKQFLFISGCAPRRGEELGWYGLMAAQCDQADAETSADSVHQPTLIESGQAPLRSSKPAKRPSPLEMTPTAINQPDQLLDRMPVISNIAPSRATETLATYLPAADSDGRLRGIAIHRMLQLLCEQHAAAKIPTQVASELGIAERQTDLALWFQEAETTFSSTELHWLFSHETNLASFNEVPVQYRVGDNIVTGIIDRLIETEDRIWIIDYKTHPIQSTQATAALADHYHEQIHLYCQAARRLFPNKTVSGGLLFTHLQSFIKTVE